MTRCLLPSTPPRVKTVSNNDDAPPTQEEFANVIRYLKANGFS